MRNILYATAAVLLLGVVPAMAATTCIDTRQIKDSHEADKGKALIFVMKDGTTYRNDLKGACPDLVFNGYSWVIRNPDNTVCDNMETIKVIQSGEICQLGAFVKVPAAAAQSKAPS